MLTKSFHAPVELKADTEGSFSALISVFNTLDDGGDVVLPSFFTDGQELPLAAWGHNWDVPSIGKGIIRVTTQGAVFDGQFNLNTAAGKEAYETVKFNGNLQEYSFGYKVLEKENGSFEGNPARFLKKGEVYEACPVLIGMNRDTRTLAIKAGQKGIYVNEPPENSFEDIATDIAQAVPLQLPQLGDDRDYITTIATFPTYAYVCVYDADGDDNYEQTYYRVEYTLNDQGDPVLSNPSEVEPSVVFTPIEQPGLQFAGHTERALAAVRGLTVRATALAALRAERKEGRTFSTANVQRMTDVVDAIRAAADDLEALLGAADQPAKAAELHHELARFLAHQARQNGVAIGA